VRLHDVERIRSALMRGLLPAGVTALWGGLLEAERHYAGEFDWRYMTVSRLLSPRDNPAGYGWAIAGIEGCGAAILLWSTLLAASRSRAGSASRPTRGLRILQWGSAGMMASGVVPLRMAGLPKLHELLTVVAFLGLCFGVTGMTHDRTRRFIAQRRLGAWRARLVGSVASGLLAAPIALAGLAQAYIFYARPDLHWVGLAWRARGVAIYLSFAFWEWLTCALLSLYLLACGASAARGAPEQQATTGY
jgi:hypothetical protein